MLKQLLLKKMFASRFTGVPSDVEEKMLLAMERNPGLFQKIALEIQEKISAGNDEMSAATEVMQAHRSELEEAMR